MELFNDALETGRIQVERTTMLNLRVYARNYFARTKNWTIFSRTKVEIRKNTKKNNLVLHLEVVSWLWVHKATVVFGIFSFQKRGIGLNVSVCVCQGGMEKEFHFKVLAFPPDHLKRNEKEIFILFDLFQQIWFALEIVVVVREAGGNLIK